MGYFAIDTQIQEQIQLVNIKGFLDAHTTPELEMRLQKLITDNQNKLVIDLKSLEYIASAGLGVFMEFVEPVREKEGDLVFCNANDKIFKIFDLLGFPLIFKFFPSTQDAIHFFNQGDK